MSRLHTPDQSQHATGWQVPSWLTQNLPDPLAQFVTVVFDRWSSDATLSPQHLGLAAGLALVLCLTPGLWRVLRQAATIIHEMGHVFTAWVVGRRVSGIKLHTDTSGVMISAGKPRGLGILLTMLLGYPAPGLLAVALAWLVTTGHAGAALTLYQLALLVSAFLALNLFGLFSTLTSLAITGFIWWHGAPDLIAFTVAGLAIFYAVAGVRCSFDVLNVHRRAGPGQALTTDAAQAARATALPLPAAFWLFLFVVISISSLIVVCGLFLRTMM